MILGCLFVAITNFFALGGPWVLKKAIDALRQQATAGSLLKYAGLIVAIAAFEGFFRFLMRKTIISASRRIEYDLRNDFFAHLQRLSQSFYHRTKTGDLMARASNDLEAVRQIVGPAVMYSLNTLTSMAAFGAMVYIDLNLTLLAMLPFPVMALVVNRLAKRLNKAHRLIQTQYAAITSKVQDNLAGIRIVKAYGREATEVIDFDGLNQDFIDKNLSMVKIRGLLTASMALLIGSGSLIVLWYGGRQVVQGTISLGEFVAFFAYLSMLTWPMIALGWVINLVQQGIASMGRINQIMATEPEIADGDGESSDLPVIRGEIEFRNVSLAYDDIPVLHEIDLLIEEGSMVAIIGPTGSGKSTLVNLIPRLIDATEGSILIDGVDVRRLPLYKLRECIGYAPQDTFLFSDTMDANIGFGIQEQPRNEIDNAAEIAQIRQDILEFPKAFDTILGERGINISGGQKQRTALARAIIKKPRILILDDSFSAIDTYTEEEILRQLQGVMRERTSIIISHRVSTVKAAHQIIFLDGGRIVERGTHDELVALGGQYADLNEKQLLEEALENI